MICPSFVLIAKQAIKCPGGVTPALALNNYLDTVKSHDIGPKMTWYRTNIHQKVSLLLAARLFIAMPDDLPLVLPPHHARPERSTDRPALGPLGETLHSKRPREDNGAPVVPGTQPSLGLGARAGQPPTDPPTHPGQRVDPRTVQPANVDVLREILQGVGAVDADTTLTHILQKEGNYSAAGTRLGLRAHAYPTVNKVKEVVRVS